MTGRIDPATPPVPISGSVPVGDPILDAAAACIQRRGFDTTSLEEVANEAGVSRTTLYRRFGSREALFSAVLWARSEPFRSWSRAILAGNGEVSERLEAVIVHATLEMQRVGWLDQSFEGGLSPFGKRLLKAVHAQGAGEGIGPLIDSLLASRLGFAEIDRAEVLGWVVDQMIAFASAPAWEAEALTQRVRFFVMPVIVSGAISQPLADRLAAIEAKVDRLIDGG